MSKKILHEKQRVLFLQSYKPGSFRVNKQDYQGHIILTDNEVTAWNIEDATKLSIDDFAILEKTKDFDLVLIGTGEKHIWLEPEVEQYIQKLGFQLEVMSTSSACRTYQIIVAEDRQFITLLIVM